MPREPLPPIEAWNALVDFVEDADMARIDALSEEELDAELIAAGLGTKDPKVRDYSPPYPGSRGDDVPSLAPAETSSVSAEPARVVEPSSPTKPRSPA